MTDPTEFKPGFYEHYKGGQYIALHLVRHHESNELFVVYVSCSHGTINIREFATPGKDSWTDEVTFHTGCVGSSPWRSPRFKFIREALHT